MTPFAELMSELWKAMEKERKYSQLIMHFYSTPATINIDNIVRILYFQISQYVPVSTHPMITIFRTYTHQDFMDFSTCKDYASIQVIEYEK